MSWKSLKTVHCATAINFDLGESELPTAGASLVCGTTKGVRNAAAGF